MATLILQTCDEERVGARVICKFLADYGAQLMASGATCIRLDKNVRRIAVAYGMDAVSYTHLTLPTNSRV